MSKKNDYFVYKSLFATIILSAIGSIVSYNSFCTSNRIIGLNGISVISSFITALAALGAVSVAISIPKQVNNEVSKLQLYNLRFNLYYTLFKKLNDVSFLEKFEKGELDDEYLKTLKQVEFLVNKEDRIILKELETFKGSMEVISENEDSARVKIILPKFHSGKLEEVFRKYLEIGDLGIY